MDSDVYDVHNHMLKQSWHDFREVGDPRASWSMWNGYYFRIPQIQAHMPLWIPQP